MADKPYTKGGPPLDFSGNGGPNNMGSPPHKPEPKEHSSMYKILENIVENQPGGKYYTPPRRK